MRVRVILGMILAIAATASAAAPAPAPAPANDDIDALSADFWTWRAAEQPFSLDDIPRIDRPVGWKADWSPAAFVQRRKDLAAFEARWKKIDVNGRPRARQADHRLVGSAISRVRWELELTRGWQRNPFFYVDQTLGSIFVLLLPPPPFDGERSAEIIRRLGSIPKTLQDAQANLTQPAAPFAKLALDELEPVRPRLQTVARELKPLLAAESASQLDAAIERATAALEGYREWLKGRIPQMPQETAVGREAYLFFLKDVALLPYSPEKLIEMGRQEWHRSIAAETYEKTRNAGLPPLKIFPDQAAQIAAEEKYEAEVRKYLEEKNILTVPAWVRHYRNLPLPAYLAPLESLGVTDDLTGPNRLQSDGVSYIRVPSPQLGYFNLSTARDPRPIILHEGVPGHYFQLVLSWAQSDPIRRHYYDSNANEGIALYSEEMMLQMGLFDDSPRTREIIYNFMRLRALRVEVDVKLALGTFSISKAAEYLAISVPMDRGTALEEAAFYAATPGVAISYQIGKLEIQEFLAESRRRQGDDFSLRQFHDALWKNGNVPISLQRWEAEGQGTDKN